jgi:hypothetical protein
VGRTRATSEEWQLYYERADEVRKRFGDPFERYLKHRRLRDAIFNLCVGVTFLGITGAVTALVFSLLGEQ